MDERGQGDCEDGCWAGRRNTRPVERKSTRGAAGEWGDADRAPPEMGGEPPSLPCQNRSPRGLSVCEVYEVCEVVRRSLSTAPHPFPGDRFMFLATKIALTCNHPPIHVTIFPPASQSPRHLIIGLQIQLSILMSIPQPSVRPSTPQHITKQPSLPQQPFKHTWWRGAR